MQLLHSNLTTEPDFFSTDVGPINLIYPYQWGEQCKANISIEVDSMPIIKDLVKRGRGYALTTYAHLTNEIKHDMVKVFSLEPIGLWRNVCLFEPLAKNNTIENSLAINFIEGLLLDTVKANLWPGASILKED